MPKFPYEKASIPFSKTFLKFKNSPILKVGIKNYRQTKSPEDILPLSGIGGKRPENIGYFHGLKLVIFKDQKHLDLKNALETIDTKIGFLERPIAVAGILGVYGFLDQFSFKTNVPEGYFEIEPLFE